MKPVMFLATTSLVLAGCAETQFVGRSDLTVVKQGNLPPPTTVDLISPQRGYVIGPLDRVSVEVFGLPELSRTVQIDASGRIALPLAGVFEASGRTPAELGEIIAAKFKAGYVRDPKVTVNLVETVSQLVTVDGSVAMPGQYPVAGRMTLIRAIARAQGTTEFARDNLVVVFRRVDNRDMAALYDLRAIRQGLYPDPDIFANDIIQVSDSRARRVFKDVITASGLITAPLVILLSRR